MATDHGETDKNKDQRPAQRDALAQPSGQTQWNAGAARPVSDAKTAEVRHGTHGAAEESSASGLERIREILFGTVQHELERRLVRTDVQLAARSHELEQEARRRTQVLELHFKRELEALAGRVERGLTETTDTLRRMAREHRDAIAGLEQRLAKVEEGMAQAERELRRQLLDQAKTFLDELQQTRKELFAALQEELGIAERALTEEFREAEEHAGH